MTRHLMVMAVSMCLVWPALAQTENLLEEQEAAEPVWQEGLTGAKQKAEEATAPIVLYFCDSFGAELVEKCNVPVARTLDWRCKALDEVLDKPRLRKVLSPCITVKLPLDHRGQYDQVAAHYGVFGERDVGDRTNLRRYYQQLFLEGAETTSAGAEKVTIPVAFPDLIHLNTFERTSLVFVSADDEILGRVVPQWLSAMERTESGPITRAALSGKRTISTEALATYVERIILPYTKFAQARQAREALEIDRALPLFQEVSESLVAPDSLNKLAEQELAGLKNLVPSLLQRAETLLDEGEVDEAKKLLMTLQSRPDLLSPADKQSVEATLKRVEALTTAPTGQEPLVATPTTDEHLPVSIKIISVEMGGDFAGMVNFQLHNLTDKEIQELGLKVGYVDVAGKMLKVAPVSLEAFADGSLVGKKETAKMGVGASMPEGASTATLTVARVVFTDGTEWTPREGAAALTAVGPKPFVLKPTEEPVVQKVLDEAEVLLASAQKAEAESKLVEAYKLYSELAKNFPEHEAGKAARKWLVELQKTPNLYRQVLDELAKADCTVWLGLAKSYHDNKMYDRALSYYQKIVDKYPGTTFAEQAKKEIALIKKLQS